MIELLLALLPLSQERIGTWVPEPLADGVHAVVPCADGTVRIFDLADGRTSRILERHTGTVLAVVAAPGGDVLATCGGDETVRLWEPATGEVRVVLRTAGGLHARWGHTLAFSPDGTRLVAVGAGGWGRVWSVAEGKELLAFPPETGTSAAAWSPSGHLATVGRDGAARLWDVAAGEELRAPLEHGEPLEVIACHPDGVRLATAGEGITTWLWDVTTGDELGSTRQGSFPLELMGVRQLRFSADGADLFITSGNFWSVAAVDVATLERRWLVENHGGSPAAPLVALDGAGERVAISTMSRIVARADGKDLADLPTHLGPFRFAPGDAYVVAYGRDATVVLDGASLRVLYTRVEYADRAYSIQRP